jgi:acylphosphatase
MGGMSEQNQQGQRDDLEELHAVVHGQVQGVGFRYYVIQKAGPLGLRGYVRNESNGDVEVVAQGSRTALERFVALLWRGPSSASVSNVQTRWSKPAEYLSGFHIRW